MATNPYFRARQPDVTDNMRAHLRIIVTTYLQAHSDQQVIDDAVLQSLHPLLASPAVWQSIKVDLAL